MSLIETGLRSDRTALAVLLELLGSHAPPLTPTTTSAGLGVDRWTVLPRLSTPRYLVPVAGGRSLRGVRFRPSPHRAGRVASRTLSLALRAGAGKVLPGRVVVAAGTVDHPSFVSWLRVRLDEPTLVAAIALGSPRANRKPVLQLLDDRGRTIGFGKLAVDVHTAALVRAEAAFLAAVPPHGAALAVPELLFHDSWKGLDLILLRDLGPDLDSAGSLQLTPAMVRSIASLGPTSTGPALESTWWQQLGRRIERLDGADREVLDRGRALIAHEVVDRCWEYGTWHGDLAPWNACAENGTLLAWDWERAGGPVPIGFDAVHNRFQVALIRDGLPGAAAGVRAAHDDAALFAALGYDPTATVALMGAYLLELRTRVAEDASHGRLDDVQWYADALTDALTHRSTA